jgi:hypothetical protein
MDEEAGDMLILVGKVFFGAVERKAADCNSFDGMADDLDFLGDAEAGFNVISKSYIALKT